MGITKIEWTSSIADDGTVTPGYTFNPWIGCQKVSAGCDNCYAEAMMDKRYGRVQWGPHGERKRTSPALMRLAQSVATIGLITKEADAIMKSALEYEQDQKEQEETATELADHALPPVWQTN